MGKQIYDNHLRQQCFSLPALCEDQIQGVLKGLQDGVDASVLQAVRNVTLTGCGDSYFAARAAVPAFKKYNYAFAAKFIHQRSIEMARYIDLPEKYGSSTMIAGISASGSAIRLREVMQRGNKYGYQTLLITNNKQSPAAQEAKNVLCVNTPVFPNSSPGLRNYYASLIAAYLLAAKLGQAKDICPAESTEVLCNAIRNLTAAYDEVLDRMDTVIFELANDWKDLQGFETIGDDISGATADFIAAKFVETAGILVPSANSEDWCHVNYFANHAESIGTIIIADVFANNRSRIGETVNQAAGIGRKVLLVSNGTPQQFGIHGDIAYCQVPTPDEGYEFLHPLLNYLPGTLLAAYIAALRNETYFRGGIWNTAGMNSITASEVVIL